MTEMEEEQAALNAVVAAAAPKKLKLPLQNELNKMEQPELRQLVTNMQGKLNQVEDLNVDLRVQLANAIEERDILKKKQESDGAQIPDVELKQIYDQLLYKDTRIMELNQAVLERERRIMDLQETCTEHGQVARSKSLAMGLLGKRLQELDSRQWRDACTETDSCAQERAMLPRRARPASRSPARNASPGRAIPQLIRMGGANGSPPPLDPTAEDGGSSYTTETLNLESLGDGGGSATKSKKYQQRKKVTFDFAGPSSDRTASPQQPKSTSTPIKCPPTSSSSTITTIARTEADYEELLMENDQLRRVISDMEMQQQQLQLQESKKSSTEKLATEQHQPHSTVQILKTKAAAQTKIRELEGIIAQNRLRTETEISELRAAVEQLDASREWALEENAKLVEQLATSKQKCEDLHGELDASLETSAIFRRRLDDNAARMDALCAELYQSRAQTQHAVDEKNIMGAEVERLKEAIFAQDEFIGMLEGDLLVYEAHVGILRDSLGATKKEDRQHIKSKAFAAKLNALEMEKQEMVKRNNDEKLRAKALAVKVRCLEQERDELKSRLREYVAGSTSLSQQQQQQDGAVDGTTSAIKPNAELAEQLQLQAQQQQQQFELQLQASERHIKKLELELETMHRGIMSICPDNFDNNFGIQQQPSLDELSFFVAGLQEQRHALDDQVAMQAQKIVQLEAQNAQLEQQLREEIALLEADLQQGQDQLAVSQQLVTSLQETKTRLTSQLEDKEAELDTLSVKLHDLGAEKLDTDRRVDELTAEVEALTATKITHEQHLQLAHKQNADLSSTLGHEQERLNKLIGLLTDIVDRFRSHGGSGGDDAMSSLDDLVKNSISQQVQKFEQYSTAEKTQEPTIETKFEPYQKQKEEEEPYQQQKQQQEQKLEEYNKKSKLFTKHVAVQATTADHDHQAKTTKTSAAQTKSMAELEEYLVDKHREQLAGSQRSVEQLQFEVEQLSKREQNAQTELDRQQERAVQLQTQLGQMEQQLIHTREQLEHTGVKLDELTAERNDLMVQLQAQEKLQLEVIELRATNAQLGDQVTLLNMTTTTTKFDIAEEEHARETALKSLASVDPEFSAQSESEPLATQSLQQQQQDAQTQSDLMSIAPIVVAPQHQDAQTQSVIQQHRDSATQFCEVEPQHQDAQTQSSVAHQQQFRDSSTQSCGDQLAQLQQEQHDNEDIPKQVSNLSSGVDHRQLLLECLQERQEFEEDLHGSVQQLMVLKTELETAADVLRAEVWALNRQLKQQFAERDTLAKRLTETEQQLERAREHNADLAAAQKAMQADTETFRTEKASIQQQLADLQARADKLESEKAELDQQVRELRAQTEQSTRSMQRLQQALQAANALVARNADTCCAELDALRTGQQQFVEQSHACLDSVRLATRQALEKHAEDAARLVTKSRDVDALVRENQQLISTNVGLQRELEQYKNRNIHEEEKEKDEKLKQYIEKEEEGVHHPPEELVMDKLEQHQKQSTTVKLSMSKRSCAEDGVVTKMIALRDQVALEADIVAVPAVTKAMAKKETGDEPHKDEKLKQYMTKELEPTATVEDKDDEHPKVEKKDEKLKQYVTKKEEPSEPIKDDDWGWDEQQQAEEKGAYGGSWNWDDEEETTDEKKKDEDWAWKAADDPQEIRPEAEEVEKKDEGWGWGADVDAEEKKDDEEAESQEKKHKEDWGWKAEPEEPRPDPEDEVEKKDEIWGWGTDDDDAEEEAEPPEADGDSGCGEADDEERKKDDDEWKWDEDAKKKDDHDTSWTWKDDKTEEEAEAVHPDPKEDGGGGGAWAWKDDEDDWEEREAATSSGTIKPMTTRMPEPAPAARPPPHPPQAQPASANAKSLFESLVLENPLVDNLVDWAWGDSDNNNAKK